MLANALLVKYASVMIMCLNFGFVTETGIHRPKPVGLGSSGSVLVLGPVHDLKNLRNLGPGPRKFQTNTDQDQIS